MSPSLPPTSVLEATAPLPMGEFMSPLLQTTLSAQPEADSAPSGSQVPSPLASVLLYACALHREKNTEEAKPSFFRKTAFYKILPWDAKPRGLTDSKRAQPVPAGEGAAGASQHSLSPGLYPRRAEAERRATPGTRAKIKSP